MDDSVIVPETVSDSQARDVPAMARVSVAEKTGQTVILNGVPQRALEFRVHCPACGRVIYAFDEPGMTPESARLACRENSGGLLEIATYCPSCGQRLRYDMESAVDNV